MAIVATEHDPDQHTGSSPACAVPTGTTHALELNATRTRCGKSASELVQWPEFIWPPAGMAAIDLCRECSDETS